MKTALIVIDMQYDFIPLAPPEFSCELVPNIADCLAMARQAAVPIVHVITEYHEDKSDWPRAFAHRDQLRCITGTRGAEIIEAVAPLPDEKVIIKTRYSGFYRTELESWLADDGIEAVALCGYSSDVCVRMTSIDAYNRDYPVTLLSDCVMPERATADEAIEYLRWLSRCEVVTRREWIDRLDSRPNRPARG